jgi:acetyl esterase/lipase
MVSQLPQTKEQILASGHIDPEFEEAFNARPVPPGSSYTIADLREITGLSLPYTQARLKASRPSDITEAEHVIPLPGGYTSRLLVCHRSSQSAPGKSPLIVIYHGGGHCVGNPESELPVARRLALDLNAVVVLPCYRFAPEHPFPASVNDSWAVLQYLASESRQRHDPNSPLLPSHCDPVGQGFIVGGVSAGANLAASVAHLARDQNLEPKLTGQMLMAGSYISPLNVPAKYAPRYLSLEQNKVAPILDEGMHKMFRAAFKPDHKSPLWAIFDQHHPLDQHSEEEGGPGVKHGHMGLPPAYFQICGLDMARDDSLIYEQVLREECGLNTKVDLYSGYPHCWWSIYPDIDSSKRRENDTVEGTRWLLALKK